MMHPIFEDPEELLNTYMKHQLYQCEHVDLDHKGRKELRDKVENLVDFPIFLEALGAVDYPVRERIRKIEKSEDL